MKIAVDFDGTIVEHRYPRIGKVMPFAFETLKALQKEQYEIILWTFRAGKELTEAVEFCKQNGVEFYAVNNSYPEEIYTENISRKIYADIYIDDRNVAGFPGWSNIWQIIKSGNALNSEMFYKTIIDDKIELSFMKKIIKLIS
ncbi:MAG: hypothetical protein JXR51_00710 [Bacteroidales bacterium]|nr:hypothetical protein [Bacteroidales bacterium]MBN2755662.1 hypothetical protein [Bacteroidales bacterium]